MAGDEGQLRKLLLEEGKRLCGSENARMDRSGNVVCTRKGTQPGKILRIKGMGLPHLGSTQKGDLLVEVSVRIPTKVNKKQEELRQTVERQQCYISGLEYALRHMTPTVVVESHEKETKEKAG